ncbi:deferrochelatase/peroxidase EfeB [Thermoleophilia bacterium SCSIO 60948]|nr:deferrochelatase/peroxidase EfeB [Thermoleophilia bacterium SCSIO 60948]
MSDAARQARSEGGTEEARHSLTRRRLLGAAGVAGVGLGLGGAGYALGRSTDPSSGTGTVPFFGTHQAGIDTAAQDRLAFGAFDVTATDRAGVAELMRAWTDAAARMTAGEPAGPENADEFAPPDDTGETLGLLPSRLTITFGFGPGLFESGGEDRYGLAAQRPRELRELPPLPFEDLEPRRGGGDVCIQACSDDPQVAFHAVHNLTRIGRGLTVLRYLQLGFGRTATTTREQDTPRNLMGLKDGTNNIRAEDSELMDDFVWAGSEAPAWLRGGTYLVARRIRMLLEVWDRASLGDQELTIGRTKMSGAPLGESDEFADVDLAAKNPDGTPAIPADAHIRLASPAMNGGARLLRRGYSFSDGVDQELGQLDAGLFFISFQRDPEQFVRVQQNLAGDRLNEYIVTNGSSLFAVPPGASEGGYVGESLLG